MPEPVSPVSSINPCRAWMANSNSASRDSWAGVEKKKLRSGDTLKGFRCNPKKEKGNSFELKHDLAADDFCLREFFATEAAFRSILLLLDLLGEFQRACGFTNYRQPATLRTLVFLGGALLGRAAHHLVLHQSASWGGLKQRIPLLESVLAYRTSTSPKLSLVTQPQQPHSP